MALGTASVQVDRQGSGGWLRGPAPQSPLVENLVDGAQRRRRIPRLMLAVPEADHRDQRSQALRGGEQAVVVGKALGERPDRRHRREHVPDAECSQDEQRRTAPQGHELSVEGQTNISRSSVPRGRVRAKVTAAATSAGGARFASEGGWYCGSRPSKIAVSIPPGMRRVTPTSPAVSAASARVSPI